VLAPPVEARDARLASDNDSALVLLVRVGDVRILLPADIEAAGEAWLTGSGQDVHADAIVVPHHGSATASPPRFLEAVRPSIAVISVGARNSYGHPAPAIVERYAGTPLYRTDESGNVTLRSDGSRLWVAPEHEPRAVPSRTSTPTRTATATR